CIGGIGHQETVHDQMATAMKEIVAQLDEARDEDGERTVEPFEELPDREEYPEYYEVIHYPMALNLVKKRIDSYRSFDAFNYDMLWIFNNATFFNEPESDIYNTAVGLEKTYKRLCREAVQKHQIPFDTSYNDAEVADGRYVSRITVGDHDLFVGDFFYMRNGTAQRVGMVSRLRVGGPADRRKFIDGRWLLTPSEVPEIAGQSVYPHQLFVGPEFEGLGVRGVQGRCFVLLPNVYARVYPQGYAAQDVYICESEYIPSADGSQPATLKPISNWAHEFKTPLMKPPAFIPYIMPFTPQKQAVMQWNNPSVLPTLAMTVLNREAAARMQSQARARQAQPGAQQSPAMPQTPTQALGSAAMAGSVRPSGMPQLQQPALQSSFNQALQNLTAQLQQNMVKAQAQLSQQKAAINKQVTEQIMAAQQQNPAFASSPQFQGLLKQQTQMLEQAQQAYNTQAQLLQQSYTQQTQALNQAFQQQQQQQQQQTMAQLQNLSPLAATHQVAQQINGMMPMSPGMGQATIASPVARSAQTSMMPMSPMQSVAMGANGMVFSMPGASMAGSPHLGMVRPNGTMSPMPMMQMADGSFSASPGMIRPSTPSRAPSGTAINQAGLSSPQQTASSAQAMMAMLLQQQQQQIRQQQQQPPPTTPKQTHMPLSPDMTMPNGQQTPTAAAAANQSQQMFEQWKKATRVFLTHGNARIERGLALQLATPNASMFLHLSLKDSDVNHAVQVPKSSSSILIRPVPGPFNSSGKSLLTLVANSRPCLPRIIPIDGIQPSENGVSDDTPSHASDDTDKDDSATMAALTKSSGYAYEVPLQIGMNMIEIEAAASEWVAEAATGEYGDQQVPPDTLAAADGSKPPTKQYLLFLTRQ
ncbi:hypothetical protein H4S02_007091, partial [Coemansia sp. RSA 2611]